MAVEWEVEGFSFWALRAIRGSNWHWMPTDGSGLHHFAHCDPERHRILGTVRYERVREALDEVKMLYLLKDKIETARKAGRDVSTQSAALQRAMQMVTDVAPPPYQGEGELRGAPITERRRFVWGGPRERGRFVELRSLSGVASFVVVFG